MEKENNYIDEIMKELKERRDWKNPKEVETFFEQKLQEVEQRKVDEITKLFDRKMLKTKGERPDVACHRGGYNQRVFEEWEIIKELKTK